MKFLLGVCGGIAAYKSCELVRLLQKRGHEVRVAMTPSAGRFVGAETFAALSGFPVYLETASLEARPFQHIDYPRWADLMLVAPATATTLARLAAGSGEEPVSLCYLAMTGQKWIAPAMNSAMFLSPAVQRNLETLRSWGAHILSAPAGDLACGESGPGRMMEPEALVSALCSVSSASVSSPSRTVLVTLGRTEEAIDPVRYISNRSSGKTGAAIVQAFLQRGCEVIAVCGPMEAELPQGATCVSVRSAQEMFEAVLEHLPQADAVVHTAAVADYRPKSAAAQKIKGSRSRDTLELEPTENILLATTEAKKNRVKNGQKKLTVVGFALETEDAVAHGLEKLQKSGADAILLNTPMRPSSGFGQDTVEFALLTSETPEQERTPKMGSKAELAKAVVDYVFPA
jgi:phosphopantothenoylcysteine decarboxylase/phosphopantothenate--cysteine ligase